MGKKKYKKIMLACSDRSLLAFVGFCTGLHIYVHHRILRLSVHQQHHIDRLARMVEEKNHELRQVHVYLREKRLTDDFNGFRGFRSKSH